MITVRSCPACAHSVATLVTTVALRTQDDHPLQHGFQVVSCEVCGTGFTNASDQSEWYTSYYAGTAKYQTEVVDEWTRAKTEAVAERVASYVAPGAHIIDVGCGAGTLVESLDARGFDVIGCDLPIPDTLEKYGKFDAVCLTGVLEHVWDMERIMRTVLSLLKPDGIVYVEVPDAARYLNPFLAPFEDFNTEHVNHLSHWSLRLLAQRYGFHTSVSHTRVIEVSPGHPAAYVVTVWRNVGRVDPVLRQSLEEYAEYSATEMRRIDDQLGQLLWRHNSFTMWGAGEFAYKLLATKALANRTLEMIVDGNPSRQGQVFGDVTVTSPDVLINSTSSIIVASQIRQESIVEAAKALGVEHRLVLPC